MTYLTKNIEELKNCVVDFSKTLPLRCVLLLQGPMAAGKTTFVHILTNGEASSPTFNLHHTYQLGTLRVEHFDLFRLKNFEEIESSGLFEILEQKGDQWVVIEWPERALLEKQKDPTYLLEFKINPREILITQL